MRLSRSVLAVFATVMAMATLALGAQAVAGRAVTGPSFTITAPDGWKDQPTLAKMARERAEQAGPLPPGAKLHIAAFGDLAARGFVVATEVDAPRGDTKPRAAVAAFHAGVRGQLEAAGLKVGSWTETDDGKVGAASYSGTMMGLDVVGRNLVGVDDKDLVRGVSAVCLAKPGDAGLAALCGGALASLSFTVPAASLAPLGKR